MTEYGVRDRIVGRAFMPRTGDLVESRVWARTVLRVLARVSDRVWDREPLLRNSLLAALLEETEP